MLEEKKFCLGVFKPQKSVLSLEQYRYLAHRYEKMRWRVNLTILSPCVANAMRHLMYKLQQRGCDPSEY